MCIWSRVRLVMSQLGIRISSSKSISSSLPLPLHKNDVLGWSLGSTDFALIKGILVTIFDIEGIETNGKEQIGVTKTCACYSVEDASISNVLIWSIVGIDCMNVHGKFSMINFVDAFFK